MKNNLDLPVEDPEEPLPGLGARVGAAFNRFANDYFKPGQPSEDAQAEAEDARAQEEERENLLRMESLANALAGVRTSYLPFLKKKHRRCREEKRQAIRDGKDTLIHYWSGYEECLQEAILEISGETPLTE